MPDADRFLADLVFLRFLIYALGVLIAHDLDDLLIAEMTLCSDLLEVEISTYNWA